MESQHPSTPNATAGDAEQPQTRLSQVEAKLKEKESLVAALTQRLEQAAEQLDRLRRTGADRGARVVGGIPPELIEEQRELANQLQQAVTDWQETNAAAALSRIEVQVAEIREIVLGLSGSGQPHTSSALTGELFHGNASPTLADEPENHRGESTETEDTGLQGWEALKAGLLSGEGGSSHSGNMFSGQSAAADSERTEESEPAATADSSFTSVPEEIPEEDPPEPIDVDTADIETLRTAVEAREAYIAHLLKRLRHATSYRVPPVDWRSLENVPEELQARLEDLERQLQEKLRISEVELSLERARMGREAARIQQLDQQIQKSLERAGAHNSRNGSAHEESPDERKKRRWLSMLGLDTDDDD